MGCGTGECGCGCGELHQLHLRPELAVRVGVKDREEEKPTPALAGDPGRSDRSKG